MSKKKSRREARAREIAARLAQADIPAYIAKGAGTAPPIAQYLPAARLFADVEDGIKRNGKRLQRIASTLAAMSAPPPVPDSLASPLPAQLKSFDPAAWRTHLIPATAPPQRNGRSPSYGDGPADIPTHPEGAS